MLTPSPLWPWHTVQASMSRSGAPFSYNALPLPASAGLLDPLPFTGGLAREILRDPFDLLIRKTPGYTPHEGSRAGIATTTYPE